MSERERADGKRVMTPEVRAGLATLGLKRCTCGEPATVIHRRGRTTTLRCNACEQNAEVDREFRALKRFRGEAGRAR